MNRKKLAKALRRLGVSPYRYNLDGKGRNDERWCLESTSVGWEVYYQERGVKTTSKQFVDEQSACSYILGMFLDEEDDVPDILPLGSVVLLQGGSKKVIITARAINVAHNNELYFFDYGAIAYPEGFVGDQMVYFQKDAVSQVLYAGYSDSTDENVVASIVKFVQENPTIKRGNPELW